MTSSSRTLLEPSLDRSRPSSARHGTRQAGLPRPRAIACALALAAWPGLMSTSLAQGQPANPPGRFSGAPAAPAPKEEAPLPRPATAPLPNLGSPDAADLPATEERRILRDLRRELARYPDNFADPELNAYLDHLIAKLAAGLGTSRPHLEIYALRDPVLNAFAMPGGLMGVNSGLIAAAGNENELAGVLAHEIGHVEQRHIARSIANQKNAGLWTLAGLALAILAARSGTSSGDNVMQAAIAGSQGLSVSQALAFSREAEREADRVGLRLLMEAGYDVSGMVGVFQRLQAQGRLYESTGPIIPSTHPLTTERIADIQNRTRLVPPKPPVDTLAFRFFQARAMVLAAQTADARLQLRKVFEARLQPGVQIPGEPEPTAFVRAGAAYGLALIELAEPKTGTQATDAASGQRALAQLDAAAKEAGIQPTHPASLRAQAAQGMQAGKLGVARPMLVAEPAQLLFARARALSRLGRQADAVALIQAAGDSGGMPLLFRDAMAQAYLDINEAGQAAAILRLRLAQQPDPAPWLVLARAYAELGDKPGQLRAQAEHYFMIGAFGSALQSMETARKTPGLDAITQSQIDARLREMRDAKRIEDEELKKRGEMTEEQRERQR
jgi:predicted Zn-dependent protease